jgi:hypothetical protein
MKMTTIKDERALSYDPVHQRFELFKAGDDAPSIWQMKTLR